MLRILLDECVHSGVRSAFPGHTVQTVSQTGWLGTEDGKLLSFAQESFDVLVTIDRNLEYQNNIKKLRLGVVVARVRSNQIQAYLPIFDQPLVAVARVRNGEVVHVG